MHATIAAPTRVASRRVARPKLVVYHTSFFPRPAAPYFALVDAGRREDGNWRARVQAFVRVHVQIKSTKVCTHVTPILPPLHSYSYSYSYCFSELYCARRGAGDVLCTRRGTRFLTRRARPPAAAC